MYKYHREHTWVKPNADSAGIGLSYYAQAHLGEIVYVDLPPQGAEIAAGQIFGLIESAKTTGEMIAPISGRVLESNDRLKNKPELINESPLDQGWIARVRPSDLSELDDLMDHEEYQAYLAALPVDDLPQDETKPPVSEPPESAKQDWAMKRIALVVKKAERAEAVAGELNEWLVRRGLEVMVKEPEIIPAPAGGPPSDSNGASDLDMVVVLGGDGTLLNAARSLGRKGVPLLGVNVGGLGFLTEISLDSLYPILEKVLTGDFKTKARMLLSIQVLRSGRTVTSQTVLNDAVINKGALARILNLSVRVNQTDLTCYRADGLIISTPTGSTAYNLSAGGPIVHPAHETIILTPICPFTLSNRPIILPESAVIEVEVDPEASDVILTADGQVSCPLEPGDKVMVSRSEASISLITNPYNNYFEIIRTKLGWG